MGRFQRLARYKNLELLLNMFDSKYFSLVEDKSDEENFNNFAKVTEKKQHSYNTNKILAFKRFLSPRMKILDFGGANGQIAEALQQFKTEVVVADTYIPKDRRPNIKYVEIKQDVLPFEKNQFDAVCCFMVLHHIKNRQTILKELARVTKTYLFIQEHNAETKEEKDLIDIQHGMYMYVLQSDDYDKTKNFDEWESYYFSEQTLKKELEQLGFKRIVYQPSKSGYLTKNYFATYVKK